MSEAAFQGAAGRLRRRTLIRAGAFLAAGLGLSSHSSLAVQAPPLAIAGDLLLVPAGGPFFSGLLPLPPAQNKLIALRLGATAVTPTA